MSDEIEDRHPISLDEALRLLADVHTEHDPYVGYKVLMGATPPSFQREYYVRCWEVVRRHAGLRVAPDLVDDETVSKALTDKQPGPC